MRAGISTAPSTTGDGYTVGHGVEGQEKPMERMGSMKIKIGAYYAFKDALYKGESDDVGMFRLIRERNHYKKWSYILAAATALATILAAIPQ